MSWLNGLSCLLLLGIASPLTAQYVHLDTIVIEGNEKTRKSLIMRELEFHAGDSLEVEGLSVIFERNRLRLMNLGVFTAAKFEVVPQKDSTHIVLQIKLTETWFVYPVPLFELADRNFNVWWKEFHRSLRRVNYGVDLSYLNLTGNTDMLKAKLQFGYSNKYELSYRRPNLNKEQTLGMEIGVSYARAHEVSYKTAANKLLFYVNSDEWQTIRFAMGGSLTWRPAIFTTHSFTAEYHDNHISDTILKLNPDFFLNGQKRQKHLSVLYNWTTDHRDIHPYPLHGWRITTEFRWNGLLPYDDLHLGRFFVGFDQYFTLAKHLSLETRTTGRLSFPRRKLPYFNNQALGYGGSFVRGYEYYVADGLDFGLFRTAFHLEIFNRDFNLGRIIPLKAFRKLPLRVFLAANNDIGYANDPYYQNGNPLSNRLLYGYGAGVDIVAYYDKTLRLEWSWNDLGESGFFIRINTGF